MQNKILYFRSLPSVTYIRDSKNSSHEDVYFLIKYVYRSYETLCLNHIIFLSLNMEYQQFFFISYIIF